MHFQPSHLPSMEPVDIAQPKQAQPFAAISQGY